MIPVGHRDCRLALWTSQAFASVLTSNGQLGTALGARRNDSGGHWAVSHFGVTWRELLALLHPAGNPTRAAPASLLTRTLYRPLQAVVTHRHQQRPNVHREFLTTRNQLPDFVPSCTTGRTTNHAQVRFPHVFARWWRPVGTTMETSDFSTKVSVLPDVAEIIGFLAIFGLPDFCSVPLDSAGSAVFKVGWLTLTHTQRWHAHRKATGSGHRYQGRFKSFPIQDDDHFLTVCWYVERNALRANLVQRAEDWR